VSVFFFFFFFQAEDGIRDFHVTGVQTCALPIWTGRIRGLIGRDFSKPMPDFDWIAQELHTSPQTLRRRLKQESTSFQEIKDLLRRDMAIYYLSHQELPINDIAERVGFTEPSTFHRAFKKWTGVTPGAWREGERGDLAH